jgi:hypothetical protein
MCSTETNDDREKATRRRHGATGKALLALLILAALTPMSAARPQQGAPACSSTAAQRCDAAYRQCLKDCDLVYDSNSGKCKYLCCEDKRNCSVSAHCSLTTCNP